MESLHSRPVYFEDLVEVDKGVSDDTFQKVYVVIMGFLLAVTFGIISDYVLLQDIEERSAAEMVGIVGANVMVFMKAENKIGPALIWVCHWAKGNKVVRNAVHRISDSSLPTIEMSELGRESSGSETASAPNSLPLGPTLPKEEIGPDFVLEIGRETDQMRPAS